jgi:thioester reductase-like protein
MSDSKASRMDFKKDALIAIETLRARVHQLESTSRQEIAIIGLAARLPGGPDPDAFWETLRDGREGISEIPGDRWDADAFYDPDPETAGKMATRRAGFIPDVANFDAQFFGISPREAMYMDPQHRLMLETSWHALENAGLAPASMAGTRGGVFMGLSTHDYLGLLSEKLTYANIDAYFGTGTSPAAAAGRISYRLGFEGPAVTVDTACSSSLVAIHQAAQALRSGECDLALAGGVNVLLTPATMINFSRARMLAPDGRCKTFDAAADGYVRGEGCGVIVMKRLDDALRDGDRIRAVIRGSAVNQDGASGGLTVPNGRAQQRVIGDALKQAGLEPREVDYLEAHGTGTSLGDPIEAQAAASVFGAGRDKEHPLLIGSVKTNIGHLEAAAGIAGVIKVVLAMEHRTLPRHLHFQTPSPHIPWDRLAVEVVRETRPWHANGKRRTAGVSSFGFSGTNAHVLLEEAPVVEPAVAAEATPERKHHVLAISARSPEALRELVGRYRAWLDAHPEKDIADVCYTAAVGRSHLEYRSAMVVDSRDRARDLLSALAEERPMPGLVTGTASDPPKTAWLFTGQGSQYVGMGRDLYESQPVFRQTLDHCEQVLGGELERPLLEVMFGDEERLRNTSYAQPALFALEMSLARLWRHWGLEPDVVLGHSVGEYAAACVAGVISLEDGLRLMAWRGRLFASLPAGGRMAAVFAEARAVEEKLGAYPSLSIAAYNGAHTVVSGPGEDVEAVAQAFRERQVRAEVLDTSHAFHSALLDPVLDEFEEFAKGFEYKAADRTLISNRTGKVLAQMVLDAGYWRRHARQPVQFAESVETLAQLGCKVLLEVGPQAVLTATALRAWPQGREAARAVASLRRETPGDRQMLEALAQLYASGSRPDFRNFDSAWGRRRLDIPNYPFQRKRFWFQANGKITPSDSFAPSEVVKMLEAGEIDELAARVNGHEDAAATRRILQSLAEHHQQERAARSTAENLYDVAWQKIASPGTATEPFTEGQTWLILARNAEMARPLADFLESQKQQCRVVAMAQPHGPQEQALKDVQRMLERERPFRILHLSSLELAETTTESLARIERGALGGFAKMLQAAVEENLHAPIWLITRGAQPVLENDRVSPAQSCLWGVGRVLALEHPELWGGLADLESQGEADWELLLRAIAAGAGEDQIAIRGGELYAARLKRRAPPRAVEPPSLRSDGSYWITGGLGALGLEAAGYLAAQGAGHIVLTSRTGRGDADTRIRALRERYSCQFHVVTADVSREEDIRRVLQFISNELPPLAGILHAAGEVTSTPLAKLDGAEIARAFRGKVWGAWHLSTLAVGPELDFFILFSSIASVWGSFGQGAYAAANAFLDGLAWYHRGRGIRATSINFGAWRAGMADEDARAQLAKRGVQAMPPEMALAGMNAVLAAGTAQGVVARVDWAKFLPVFQLQSRRPLMAEMEREYPTAVVHAANEKTPLVRRLAQAPSEQRKAMLQEYLRNAVADTMRLDPAQIREDAGFFDLGMDSLMAIELRQRLEKDLGRSLPATIAIDYPRLTDVAGYLLTDVLGLQEQAKPAAVASTAVSGGPIAIIGLGCRFPGAPNREAFWDLLARGGDAIRETPNDRFDINEYFDPDPETPGKIYTRYGGFLDGVDRFEPEMFGISPREAMTIEPQQRLMLETVWESLEHAGYAPSSLARSRTGLYIGVGANEYSHLLGAGSAEAIDAYFITGNALNVIAGRVAFSLGLEGPAMAVDTACSSSLVAIHQACQALRSGECDTAIAGGVNVLLSPATTIAACRARMLAPDGHCKTFDASADGYVRGEGCGVIVLKRLEDALRDGDRVRAVIRGSAVNQDGASGGLTVPNGRAQQRVITEALGQAGLQPADVDYLEAHGTGTSLGDPIEVQAAAAVLGPGRDKDHPLWIGSVKTNIGHLESASGIAGVIKVVLAMEHGILPQHLHFKTPSPHIPWDRLPVQVVRETKPWTSRGKRRTAGVSSFGFSGTNAHVLLEEAPAIDASDVIDATPPRPFHFLPVSARGPEALQELGRRYQAWLDAHPEADIADVAWSAAIGRSHLEHRAGLVVDSREKANELFQALAEERSTPGLLTGICGDPPKTAWLFTGQGSQYVGMGRELFETQPVFRQTLEKCAEVLREELAQPLLEVMFEDAERIGHTSYAQPALFALEMSLAALWRHWGLEPDVVLGHSVGEYAAACVAGVFGVEDGLRLMVRRGKLFGGLPPGGRMAAVFADAGVVEEWLEEFPSLSVAAYNGSHTVISGPGDDVKEVADAFKRKRIRCEMLETSHAFHSALLDPVLDEFEEYAKGIEFKAATRTLIANRTGKVLGGQTVLDAAYWRRHARQPVQFAESVSTLSQLGCKVLLEVGPQAVLTATALRAWPEGREAPRAVASLRKDIPDNRHIVEALGQLYAAGSRPDFRNVDSSWTRRKLDLPTYPFQRRRFWPKTEGLRGGGAGEEGLLGARRDLASGDVVYSSRFSIKDQPWLEDHIIYGTVVVPGATYAAMAMHSAGLPAELQEVFFYEPIIFTEKEAREVQLTLHTPEDATPGLRTFQVHSRPWEDRESQWSLNAGGTLVVEQQEPLSEPEETLDTIRERLSPMRPQQLFEGFAQNELKWGPTWRTSLKSIWGGEREALGEITVGEELAAHLAQEPIHPVLLDLCTGVAGASLLTAQVEASDDMSLFLPLKYERVALRERTPRHFFCRAAWQEGAGAASETQAFNLDFFGPDGRFLGGIKNFIVKRAPRQALLRGLGNDSSRLLYSLTWRELPLAAPAEGADTRLGTWLLVGRSDESTGILERELAARKQSSIRVTFGQAWPAIEEERVTLDPGRVEHWDALLKLLSDRGESPAGIVWQVAPGAAAADPLPILEPDVTGLLTTVQNLSKQGRSPLPRGLWIVTERAVAAEPSEDVDPVQASFWGMGRTIAAEQPTARCVLIDHDTTPEALRSLADLLIAGASEPEMALRQKKCFAPRLMPWNRSGRLPLPGSPDYRLEPTERGAIENLQVAAAEIAAPGPGYVQVQVEAAGLNFRDILNVLGLYPGDPGAIGGELAGIVTAVGAGVTEFRPGQRVFGFSPGGGFSSRANVPYLFVVPKPPRVSAVEASTLPATMLTAGLAFEWAKPKPGERVLIHAASGGVGLAAIQLARNAGAIVYATASKPKQKMLRDLGIEHIYDSRSTDFADQILADTGGAGVDVVLNSLTNEGFVEATVRATAKTGRFVEIAKRDIWSPEKMAAARPDIAYDILALDDVMQNDPMRIKQLLTELAAKLETGELAPLPYQVYPLTEAKAAFRCMQQARHIGKIVLRMPSPLRPQAGRSYLITGGLGALGVRTAAYLAQMGANDIVLTSRRPADESTQQTIDGIAEQFNARIHVFPADIADQEQVTGLLRRIRKELPPLGGVVHAAGVLEDALVPQQSWHKFVPVMTGKVLGAWRIHHLTKGDDLDFFLLYSSASGLLGSPGQVNYAAANAMLDGLAAHRQAHGLAASSINWGPWAEAGMAASEAARANLGKQGLIPLKPAAALAALGEIVSHGSAQAMVIRAKWDRTAKLLGAMRPPILEHVLPKAAAAQAGDKALLRALYQVPPAQRGSFLTEHLQRELQHILGLAQPPGPDSRFLELGMDSLMAVELRNRLLAQMGSGYTISSTVVFDYPTIRALAEYLASQAPETAAPATPATAEANVAAPTVEALRNNVAELLANLKPLRELGIHLQWNGHKAEGESEEALVEGAILRQESEVACREVMDDAVLPDDIRPAGPAGPPPARRHALLTGATGYLGGYLLRDLLRAGMKVTAVVRCQHPSAGMAKIGASLKQMGIWEHRFAEMVTVVAGDIEQPRFGLAPDAYAKLADETDTVFHCAAAVQVWRMYSQLRNANVTGTRHVLELTCSGTPKVLHHVSAAAVFHAPSYWGQRVDEGQFPESPFANVFGYGQSKWAAEKLATEARSRGAHVVVYRLAALLGGFEAPFWSPTDLATRFLAHSLAAGVLSERERITRGLPVDLVARFITAASADPSSVGRTFHVVHPRPLDAQGLSELLARGGIRARLAPHEEWARLLKEQTNGDGGPLFEMRGVGVNRTLIELWNETPELDSGDFPRQLAAYKIPCPDYESLIASGWLKALYGN